MKRMTLGAWMYSMNDLVIRIDADGRTCTECGDWKEWDKFPRYHKGKNGHRSKCSDCHNRMKRVDGKTRYALMMLEKQPEMSALYGYPPCHGKYHWTWEMEMKR